MDALELLKQDHAKVKKLFDKAESVDNREQKRIFSQIKTELEIHAQDRGEHFLSCHAEIRWTKRAGRRVVKRTR